MLIDTNIFIELLMIGANFEKVFEFFTRIPMKLMVVTDFTVHSVGILLNRFGKIEYYAKFINDLVVGGVSVVSLDMVALAEVPEVIERYNLDFDDAYQYVAAEKYHNHQLRLGFQQNSAWKKDPRGDLERDSKRR